MEKAKKVQEVLQKENLEVVSRFDKSDGFTSSHQMAAEASVRKIKDYVSKQRVMR